VTAVGISRLDIVDTSPVADMFYCLRACIVTCRVDAIQFPDCASHLIWSYSLTDRMCEFRRLSARGMQLHSTCDF